MAEETILKCDCCKKTIGTVNYPISSPYRLWLKIDYRPCAESDEQEGYVDLCSKCQQRELTLFLDKFNYDQAREWLCKMRKDTVYKR